MDQNEKNALVKNLAIATSLHYKKFNNYDTAFEWSHNNIFSKEDLNEYYILQLAAKASNPFQFMSKIISLYENNTIGLEQIPVSQDASASAYQIMSLFLLDEKLAKLINLHPASIGQIYDIHSYL